MKQGAITRLIELLRIDEHGCWIFQGNVNNYGYGRFRGIDNKKDNVHTFMYNACNVRQKTPGFEVHHTCHKRLCVNPSHLVLKDRTLHKREHMIERWKVIKAKMLVGSNRG